MLQIILQLWVTSWNIWMKNTNLVRIDVNQVWLYVNVWQCWHGIQSSLISAVSRPPSQSQAQLSPGPASASRNQLSIGQSEQSANSFWPIRGQETGASSDHLWSPLPASLRLRQQLGGPLTNQRGAQDCVSQSEGSVCDHVTGVVADWDGSQSVYTSDSRAQLEVTHWHSSISDTMLNLKVSTWFWNMDLRTRLNGRGYTFCVNY